jgi:NADPH-dependent ferric siderophore reductase
MEQVVISQPERTERKGPRLLHVVRVKDVTPKMRRITLGGAALDGFPQDRSGSHVKVLLAREGQDKPVLPTLGPAGPVWPAAEERPYARTYTIRAFRPFVGEAGELDIDFVLHGDNGPASRWAMAVCPGDFVGIAGPGARGPIPQNAGRYIFAADSSALPALSAHLERLPANARGMAFVEVDNADEEQTLAHPEGITLTWLHRNGMLPADRTLLAEAVRQVPWPDADLFFWIAGEASAVAALHHYGRVERRLERNQVDAVPYWKAGVSEEIYHDERHRVMDEDKE